jgi:hypothetical protein
MPKLCVNCRFVVEKYYPPSGDIYECKAPQNMETINFEDPVNGDMNTHSFARESSCNKQRREKFPFDFISNTCGRRGRWFKKKVV